MITPKEKAEQLVDKFDDTLTYLESKSKAKQCALIAVDEIIDEVKKILDDENYSSVLIYWLKVKQEIEKL